MATFFYSLLFEAYLQLSQLYNSTVQVCDATKMLNDIKPGS